MTNPNEATDMLFRRVNPIACVSCVACVLACEVIEGDENHRDPQIAFGMNDRAVTLQATLPILISGKADMYITGSEFIMNLLHRSAAAPDAAVLLLVGALVSSCATIPTAAPEVRSELAPTGKLRAAINFGNPVLAQKEPATGEQVYQNTRRFLLSQDNPYYCLGRAAYGLGGPHVGVNMIWPLGIIIQGLTSTSDDEIRECLRTLQQTHAGTGFIHEAFNKDDPKRFTRPWFAWANTIFGELVWKTFNERPQLLN